MRNLFLSAALAVAVPAAAGENVVLVLDASGSMWGQIDGRAKADIAKEAVAKLVAEWNPDNALGLVAYGHRRKGDCTDIETLIPYGPLDPAAFMQRVNGLKFLGMTPLSAAVIQAADSLKSSEQKATVILVSDGEETCALDPCTVGRELQANGVDFTAHVIGFNVPNPAHQAQLRCLAENTGGRFFNARDAGELNRALSTLVEVSTEKKLAPASATLSGPASAPVVSAIEVSWTGPADQGDYVALIKANGASVNEFDYAWALADKPNVALNTPAALGDYELAYISPRRDPAILARIPLDVTEVTASLDAPDSSPAGVTISVTASGPVAPRHWIGFAPKGSPAGTYRSYKRPTGPTSVVELKTPAEPGDYELRYVLNESERVLISRPIRITGAGASVEAPASVEAGSLVEVLAKGPSGPSHWIGFAPKGSPIGTYRDYVRPSGAETRATLLAPSAPGAYEIRYVLDESGSIAAAQAITVVDPSASLEAPDVVVAGASVRVRATGPVGRGRHWVGFAAKGAAPSSYLNYARPTGPISELDLTAPMEPGDYEIRFVLNESDRVLVSRPIKVIPQ